MDAVACQAAQSNIGGVAKFGVGVHIEQGSFGGKKSCPWRRWARAPLRLGQLLCPAPLPVEIEHIFVFVGSYEDA